MLSIISFELVIHSEILGCSDSASDDCFTTWRDPMQFGTKIQALLMKLLLPVIPYILRIQKGSSHFSHNLPLI